ncbi:putative hydrolase [Gordonia araii NBRC 100433]|uniref:Beta-phosphoglucomutase n=1 Tax=Gordonia araii NBRC 100433 TaxID=1073574 RepID=G7H631_9ACTN|nr:beta-phosphoglucomutase family hydrolase [Gordonia araii]NNG98731.1 beta-phosphoglucomutase family hydrolase [Gordonia araii NBRC 100433]GAB11270.1 putative hydrolase [Gordonia araii NBRC 100433]
MLGLDDSITVALFDLDGVLTDTASVHMTAWTETFNEFLAGAVDDNGDAPAPFTPADYLAHVDGRPREDGINGFLGARHLTVDRETVDRLAADKNARFLAILDRDGVTPYPDAVAYLHAARDAGLGIAVVTSSRNGGPVLEAAGLSEFVAVRVDGNVIVERGLAGKPAPDSFLLGAELMGVGPAQAAVFEDAVSGVAAGAAGDFATVVGVDRTAGETQPSAHAAALAGAGATVVVTSLDQLRTGTADSPEGAPQ